MIPELCIGYNIRKNVWAHLNSRSQAIQTALKNYNSLAEKMNPPAEILDAKKIMELTFVAEFDLLRQSYGDMDVLQKPWMAPANRLVCNKLFKVVRAEEELDRLNVEMRRLRTWLYVEEKTYRDVITALTAQGQVLLAAEVRQRYDRRQAVNNNHHSILNVIEKLAGFTGQTGLGTPMGWSEDMVAELGKGKASVDMGEGEAVARELEREACRDDTARLAAQVENLNIQD